MKKYPFVKQSGFKDCGVCSLKMIIQYYGGNYPLEKLRNLTNTTKEGTSAYDLIEGAKKIGLDIVGYHVELKEIKNEMLPAIAYTIINQSLQHYVVIYKITQKYVIIADPASKVKKISILEFNHIYQKILLVCSPITTLPKYHDNKIIQNELKKIINQNKKKFIVFIILTPLTIVMSIILTLQTKILIEYYNQNELLLFSIVFIIIIVIKTILEKLKNAIFLENQQQMDKKLYTKVLEKIILLPYKYYRNRTTGEIISKIQDLEKVSNFISLTFTNLVVNILFIIFSSIILLNTNKIIFLILIILILTVFIISLFYQKKKILLYKTYYNSNSNFYSNLTETINGFETVKGLSLEQNFSDKLSKQYKDHLNIRQTLEKIQFSEKNIQNMIYYLGNTILIWISCFFLKEGQISFSEFLLFFSFYSYFFQPFIEIAEFIYELKEIKFSIQNVNDIINYDLIEAHNSENKSIQLNYHNLNINIKESEKVILLGASGSGKSTLLKAMKGYDTIENFNVGFNSKDIAYISQNEILFTDTIYNNIVLDSSHLKELDNIIKMCQIDSIIKSKKLGLNTMIEENGFNLSGGEKQRIILARTLLTAPKVLLIDEGLSQVNIKLERTILKNIINYYKDMTIIFVSHRDNNSDLFHQKLILKEE